jgi:pimeloyl-ACP methyl ester carboxylesterase
VLVHGAAHGAWCWEAVAERLRKRGRRVVAPDLPGHGARAAEHARASVAAYAAAVVDTMALAGVSRAVLVGHSMAGIVIPKVAEAAPERVAHLVFLAAIVLPDGGSLFETHFSAPVRDLVRGMVRAGPTGTFRYPAVQAWARWMSDLPPGHPAVQAALPRLTPQPIRPFVERVDMKGFYALGVPRTYIRCLKDRAVTPEQALAYARRLGAKPLDLDAGHDAMLSKPDRLATILGRLGGEGRER